MGTERAKAQTVNADDDDDNNSTGMWSLLMIKSSQFITLINTCF